MENTNVNKLNGFECFWCKSIHLDKLSDDKYKCKSCGNINYKLTDNDNVKFIMASTYIARYNYEKADRIYQELSESENTKTKVQALYGRLLSFFGVTYIKDFNGSLVVTFSNYKPEFSSITECSYYKDIINSEYKDEYINKLNELDTEYKRIKKELNKGIKYDVFICTKISLKTKDNPNLKGYTEDSIYASKIYDELTKKGLKVFYSDKVLSGIDYDAQIYSALMRSEKILVISSDREYLESAWVQSEWERWINFIKEDVKDKNSLYLFVPNNTPIELPRKLEKTQKFTDTLELVNRLAKNNVKETQVKVSIDELLNEARYNLNMFDLEEAEKIYKQITHDYPNDYRGWLGLVDILIEKGITKEDKRYQRWFDMAFKLCDENKKKELTDKYIKPSKNEDNQNIDNLNVDNLNVDNVNIERKNQKVEKQVENFIIDYDLDNGICENLPKEFSSDKMIELPVPTRKEYEFIGWYDENNNLVNKLEYKNYNLKAKWKEITYTINYDLDNGICENLPKEFSSDKMIELPVPTKKEYEFIGWYDENNILINKLEYRNYNLKAKWEEITYIINYDLSGGKCNNLPEEFSKSNMINLPTPTKKGYIFLGWYDENKNLVSNLELKDYNLKAIWFEGDDNNIYFGKYPQTKVLDNKLIKALNIIKNANKFGYIEYNGIEYKKYNDDYYIVEPIKWKILEQNNNTYKLLSDVILDKVVFYENIHNNRTIANKPIYPNNYEYSNIRAWLNGYDGTSYNVNNYINKGFLDMAFTDDERKLINETIVDNSGLTTKFTDNPYVCNNTIDKIYLLSYKDITKKYFKTREKRSTKVSGYAKAAGVITSSSGCGDFWLRSAHDDYFNCVYDVYYIGGVFYYYVDGESIGVRPVLDITIN